MPQHQTPGSMLGGEARGPSVRPASCLVHIAYILLVRNLNSVCGCILGWQSVAYHIRFTVTLTSDLVLE